MGVAQWFSARFGTAEAVYGTILYSALIAVASGDDDTALDVLLVAGFSLFVFWGAHVYAGTIANHAVKDGVHVPLSQAVRHSTRDSSGMLLAGVLPSIALLLGACGLIGYDLSVDLALWLAVLVLFVLGYRAFADRRSPIIVRVLGGLGCAAFGLVLIVLNTIVH